MSEDIESQLQQYLSHAYPDRINLRIAGLARINEGWESDVYAFRLLYGLSGNRLSEDLILRIYPGNDALPKSSREYGALSMLHQADYPVPRVYHLDTSGAYFSKPFMIMEKIDGQPMWPMIGPADDATRLKLLRQFCGLFVQLHRLDWRPFVEDPRQYEPGELGGVIGRQFALWQGFTRQFPHSDFDPVMQWLLDHRSQVTDQPASIVHWDFHPNNILVRADGSAAVIDWTGIDFTDSRFDLAWTLLLLLCYEGPQVREVVLREYERQWGQPVKKLEFFDVAACLRRLFSIMVSVMEGAEKLGMRPGAQAQMVQIEPIRRIYNLLLERTGIRLAAVEQLLAR